jgi:RimK family alpha-L-glutamate ligase
MAPIAVLGTPANETNSELVAAWQSRGIECELVAPLEARRCLVYDAVVARLDVRPTLDGVEPGLLQLLWLERRHPRVHNGTRALLATHDKLRTAAALERAQIPHPPTWHLKTVAPSPLSPPVVLKPRFGSWGRDVRLCQTDADIDATVEEFATRPWFCRHGVLVQAAVPSPGFDLRLLVAGGRVVGAIERHAAPGEWRTNLSVGGSKHAAHPPRPARALAVAAAAAVGADLVGVDLLPTADGYTVIELNGAVDFDADYRKGGDIYAAVADALGLTVKEETWLQPPGSQRASGRARAIASSSTATG